MPNTHLVMLLHYCVVLCSHLAVSSCHLVVSGFPLTVFLSFSSSPPAWSVNSLNSPLLPVLAFFLIFPWLASLTRRCQVSWSSSRSFLKWSSVRWTETLPHCAWLGGQEVINRLYSLDVERGSFTLRNSENVFYPHYNNFKTHQ